MGESTKIMTVQEYLDLFRAIADHDDKFKTISELHEVFAKKFAEYDAEILKLKQRIAELEANTNT